VYSFKNAFAIRYIFVQAQLAKHCQDHVKTWPEIFLITSNQVANVSASIKSSKSSAMSHLIKSCIRHKPGGYKIIIIIVVSRILEQWQPLKLFFTSNWYKDRLKSSEDIYKALHDPSIFIYLNFLQWVLL